MLQSLPVPLTLDTTTPVWTLRDRVEQTIRHINQTGGDYFAVITVLFEPSSGPDIFQFLIDTQRIGEEYHAQYSEPLDANELHIYAQNVLLGITTRIQDQRDQQLPIGYIKMTLTRLLIHPVDSKPLAYRTAGYLAAKRVFDHPRLIPLDHASLDALDASDPHSSS